MARWEIIEVNENMTGKKPDNCGCMRMKRCLRRMFKTSGALAPNLVPNRSPDLLINIPPPSLRRSAEEQVETSPIHINPSAGNPNGPVCG